jgi:hypothetical protein
MLTEKIAAVKTSLDFFRAAIEYLLYASRISVFSVVPSTFS